MIGSISDVLAVVSDLWEALPRLPNAERRLASDVIATLLLDLKFDDQPAEGESTGPTGGAQ